MTQRQYETDTETPKASLWPKWPKWPKFSFDPFFSSRFMFTLGLFVLSGAIGYNAEWQYGIGFFGLVCMICGWFLYLFDNC